MYWFVYLSSDKNFSVGDYFLASGETTELDSGVSTTLKDILCTWPTKVGPYYLIAEVYAIDDSSINRTAFGSYTVGPEYSVTAIAAPDPLETGSTFTSSLTITNSGAGNGQEDVDWAIYISSDAVYGGDTEAASGTILGGLTASGTTSPTANSSEAWPAAGNYWLIAVISAADDTNTTNNEFTSGPYTITDP